MPFPSLSNRQKAILWMLAWAFSYSLLSVCIKAVSGIPKSVVLLVRFLPTFPILAIANIHKPWGKPDPKNLTWYLLRGVVGIAALLCTYFGYDMLPLNTMTAIGYTEPTMEVILAILFLHTPTTLLQWCYLLVAYAGVFVMNRPFEAAAMQWVGIALLANFLASIAKVISKHLVDREPLHQTMLYGNLIFCLLLILPITLSLVAPSYVPATLSFPSNITLASRSLLPLLGLPTLGLLGQYCYGRALQLASFNFIGIATYLRIPFMMPLSWWYEREPVEAKHLLGLLLIVLANFGLMKEDERKKN